MSVKTAPAGAVNGMPGFTDYQYGASRRVLRPAIGGERADRTRKGQRALPERITAALRALGGEASMTDLRTALELDGGPAFTVTYLYQALRRLAEREPAMVSPAGRESSGRGRPGRWRLGPGAGGGAS
jgi:hypothetical protein